MIGLLMLAAAVPIAEDPAVQRQIDQSPKAVRTLIKRRAGCNYFASEEPYDRDRARDLANKARLLRCTALERDERVLRQRYANRPAILQLLAITQDVIY